MHSYMLFYIGSKFQPVSNFTELHDLTQAARSYVVLVYISLHILYNLTASQHNPNS